MTDEQIAYLVQQGQTQAYNLLLDRYKGPIFNYIYQMIRNYDDADDLAQDTFVKAFQSIQAFRGDASVKNWLYRIASNVTTDWLRKKRVRQLKFWHDLVPDYENQQPYASAESEVMRVEGQLSVKQAVGRLSFKYQQVIILKHFHDLEYQQIARILNLPKRTVETRLYRARQLLKEALKEGHGHGMPSNTR